MNTRQIGSATKRSAKVWGVGTLAIVAYVLVAAFIIGFAHAGSVHNFARQSSHNHSQASEARYELRRGIYDGL